MLVWDGCKSNAQVLLRVLRVFRVIRGSFFRLHKDNPRNTRNNPNGVDRSRGLMRTRSKKLTVRTHVVYKTAHNEDDAPRTADRLLVLAPFEKGIGCGFLWRRGKRLKESTKRFQVPAAENSGSGFFVFRVS